MAQDKNKLSSLGTKAEKVLTELLKDMEKDLKMEAGKYSLTDQMKVMDRVLKLEAIKSKVGEEEGSFFTFGQGADDEQ